MRYIHILLILLSVFILGARAQAQVFSLKLSGDPGDYVSGGQCTFLTTEDATFSAQENYTQGFPPQS